jgi:fructokinase
MGHQILAIGEVLWDLLPQGKQLGGAPANFTYHCRSLGAEARLVTRVGDDALGREVLERFRLLGMPTEPVQIDPELPTGTVDIALADDGQPRFTIQEDVAWDRIMADEDSLGMAARADAICFGSLCQRSEPARTAIRSLVSTTRPGALRLFDVNLRPPFVDRDVIADSLTLANALKLNLTRSTSMPMRWLLLSAPSPGARQLCRMT